MSGTEQEPQRESEPESESAPSEPIEKQAASRDNLADEGVPTDPEHPTG